MTDNNSLDSGSLQEREPHARSIDDAFFRGLFRSPEGVRQLLRFQFSSEDLQGIDLEKIEAVSFPFISDDLKRKFTDLIFTAPMPQGGVALIFLWWTAEIDHDGFEQFGARVIDQWNRQHQFDPNIPEISLVLPLIVHR